MVTILTKSGFKSFPSREAAFFEELKEKVKEAKAEGGDSRSPSSRSGQQIVTPSDTSAARARAAELARIQALRQQDIQRKMAEQERRNLLARQTLMQNKSRIRQLVEQRKRGNISREEFKERNIKLLKDVVKTRKGLMGSASALSSKTVQDKLRQDIKQFEMAQGSKITDVQLTNLLKGRTITAQAENKVVGNKVVGISGIVSPFQEIPLINVIFDKEINIADKIKRIKRIKDTIPKGTFDRYFKGFQKVVLSEKFRSKEIKKEQTKKKEETKERLKKQLKQGGKIDFSGEIVRSFEDKDISTFSKISGATTGLINPLLGAAIWSVGEIGERTQKLKKEKKDVEVTKRELSKIAVTSATKGAILGFLMKVGGKGLDITGKNILTRMATRNTESVAIRSAVNHGGQLIKVTGKGGKNLITTYFYKDIIGNVYEVTSDVKNLKFINALKKITETGGAVGGFIGGAKLGSGAVKGVLVTTGKFKPTLPEKVQKKIPADVMAKQLLSKGKIILTRRGVYETGRGLVPRKDAWLDQGIKIPTKGIFWRFDKTLDKKGDAISPLPLFTKDKSKYWRMFKKNWEKNKGLGLIKRYVKTTAETPIVDDILIRKAINIKDIKDKKLRAIIIKEFATTGKLTKTTQNKILKKKLSFSDKNRERGFHDENEFVTRKVMKLKNKKDISWTFDPVLKEYIPVVQSLKDAGRIKNFLTVLRKKKIITRTDAQYIKDNFAIKKKFGERAILPKGHSFNHMKNVGNNIIKLIDKYPEFNKYWKKRYGSIANAKIQLKKAMWHDIGKTSESSVEFGTPHGQKVWNVWKAGLLPKGIKLKKAVAKAIKVHEDLDPRKIRYKIKNKIGKLTPEEKIVATADRLDLTRYNIKIDPKRLPLRDAIKRLNIEVKEKDYPKSFSKTIAKIKSGKKVSKQDIKKLTSWKKRKISKIKRRLISTRRPPTRRPSTRRPPTRRPSVRPPARPPSRPPVRPPTRRPPTRRPPTRPPISPPRRPPRRPPTRPPISPPRRPPRRPPTRPPASPPRKPPTGIIFPSKKGKPKKQKPQQGFNVFGKHRGKFIKLNRKPLSKKDALDRLSFSLDNSVSRTGKFVPAGRVKEFLGLGSINKKERGHFQKNRKKLRNIRIVKGKGKLLRNKYIERVGHAIDTRGEVTGLSIAKLKRQEFGFRKPRRVPPPKPLTRKLPQRQPTLRRQNPQSGMRPPQRNTQGRFISQPLTRRPIPIRRPQRNAPIPPRRVFKAKILQRNSRGQFKRKKKK